MTATTFEARTTARVSWLRITMIGLGLGIIGVLMMGLSMLFGQETDDGPFKYTADYILTASALPQGVGLLMATLGFHRLQGGRDGRLGAVGVWVYAVCMVELVIQCMASVVVGEELIWGPLYPLCALGLMIGLVLLSAGSWNVGLLPKWMLAAWPPLGLIGSFGGLGPVPLLFVVFLGGLAYALPRRVNAR